MSAADSCVMFGHRVTHYGPPRCVVCDKPWFLIEAERLNKIRQESVRAQSVIASGLVRPPWWARLWRWLNRP